MNRRTRGTINYICHLNKTCCTDKNIKKISTNVGGEKNREEKGREKKKNRETERETERKRKTEREREREKRKEILLGFSRDVCVPRRWCTTRHRVPRLHDDGISRDDGSPVRNPDPTKQTKPSVGPIRRREETRAKAKGTKRLDEENRKYRSTRVPVCSFQRRSFQRTTSVSARPPKHGDPIR